MRPVLLAAAVAAGVSLLFATPASADEVIPDDLIVQGSHCVGLDCVNNESFGFDTLRLKENNTRIKFDDTSTAAGFPANDWTLSANEAPSGGASRFMLVDDTAGRVPFSVSAGAPADALVISASGDVRAGRLVSQGAATLNQAPADADSSARGADARPVDCDVHRRSRCAAPSGTDRGGLPPRLRARCRRRRDRSRRHGGGCACGGKGARRAGDRAAFGFAGHAGAGRRDRPTGPCWTRRACWTGRARGAGGPGRPLAGRAARATQQAPREAPGRARASGQRTAREPRRHSVPPDRVRVRVSARQRASDQPWRNPTPLPG